MCALSVCNDGSASSTGHVIQSSNRTRCVDSVGHRSCVSRNIACYVSSEVAGQACAKYCSTRECCCSRNVKLVAYDHVTCGLHLCGSNGVHFKQSTHIKVVERGRSGDVQLRQGHRRNRVLSKDTSESIVIEIVIVFHFCSNGCWTGGQVVNLTLKVGDVTIGGVDFVGQIGLEGFNVILIGVGCGLHRGQRGTRLSVADCVRRNELVQKDVTSRALITG